jgi:hypothetical protein
MTGCRTRKNPVKNKNVQILIRRIFFMHKKVIACSLILIIALILSAGCSVLSPKPEPTPVPTTIVTTEPTTIVTTATPTATPTASTIPGPTRALPDQWPLSISVEKAGTYSETIMTHFDGGKGMSAVLKLTSTVTRPDGTVTTKSIDRPRMGDVIEIEGTGGTDRVEVTVLMNSGESFKVIDQQVRYKTRN